MRTFLILLTCLSFISTKGKTQITFNKQYHLNYPAMSFTGVVPTDTGYYVVGVLADSVPPFRIGNIWIELDELGNVDRQKILKDSLVTYETWSNQLHQTVDGGFVSGGYSYRPEIHSLLIKYNNEGDTVFTKTYLHPRADSSLSFISAEEVLPLSDSGFISVHNIARYAIEVMRLDPKGNILWRKSYDDPLLYDGAYSIIAEQDGGFLISAWRSNTTHVSRNFTNWPYLLKIDHSGEVEWEYLWPNDSKHGPAFDVVKGIGGGWLVSTAIVEEITVNSTQSIFVWDASIFKLNEQRGLEWELKLPQPESFDYNQFNRLITVSDNSGYVAAGALHSPNEAEYGYDITGWLYKVSPTGDSLWSRRYQVITSRRDEHKFVDLKETSDGGFVMCGQVVDRARDTARAEAAQQGWLVKVDEYGCLVPGCHLVTKTKDEQLKALTINLYPNPVGDFLNVHISDVEWRGRFFQLHNSSGQLMRKWPNAAEELTQMLSMNTYPTGWYVLSYWTEAGELLWTEKVIKP